MKLAPVSAKQRPITAPDLIINAPEATIMMSAPYCFWILVVNRSPPWMIISTN